MSPPGNWESDECWYHLVDGAAGTRLGLRMTPDLLFILSAIFEKKGQGRPGRYCTFKD